MTDYGSIHKPLLQQPHVPLSNSERDLLQADRPGYGTRKRYEVAFNLVNATVGAGIMGLPYAVSHAGFVTGIVASVWVACLSQLGLYMLILAGKRAGIYKYAVLVEHVMGRFGYHFLNFMIVVQAGGGCISYFILLGDTIPVLLDRYLPQYPILSNRAFFVTAISMICILPLNMRRSIGSLARWSIVSVMCLPIIIVTILIRAPAYYDPSSRHHDYNSNDPTWVGKDVFGAMGIMAFAFTCAQVAFNNFLTLKDQSHNAWRHSTIMSTSMSWTVSMVFAVVGYVCFGTDVKSNLFQNFAEDDVLINIGRFALGFSMIFTIPMCFYPTREAVQKSLGFETATKQPTQVQHYIVTVVVFVILMATGITVNSLGKVYSLAGGFAATTLSNILPAAAHLVTRYRRRQPAAAASAADCSPTLTTAPTLTVAPTLSTNTNNYKILDDKTTLSLPAPIVGSDVQSSCSSSPRVLPVNYNHDNGRGTPPPTYNYTYYPYDEEDVSTVDGAEMLADDSDSLSSYASAEEPLEQPQQRPRLQFLDIIAVVLIFWGLLVMFLSVSSVLTES
ncbi:transmembrane amino acid transporter protein-domain-containing protein [Zychaea mexicana]|uniref:transmembrane amino acid transporter protein-domain-containing protein n=1 Tax=Zychaea mexicana TaxID=64656 RepID=UPI0022FE6031|nr:transmembrane amino acid transporter protein-domain-containing protein [Zychaea mexicana]KAI9490783.1 transmembrane amino acid transporter protein-domain-containing protein [Zychaea mexicana]